MKITLDLEYSPEALSLLKEAPENVKVEFIPFESKRAYMLGDAAPIISFVIDLAKGVSVGLFVAWLYDKLKNCPPKKITIKRRKVTWDKGEITKIIEEEFKSEE